MSVPYSESDSDLESLDDYSDYETYSEDCLSIGDDVVLNKILRISRVSDSFVRRCVTKLREDYGQCISEIEEEPGLFFRKGRKDLEASLYCDMETICQFIVDYESQEDVQYHRQFHVTDPRSFEDEDPLLPSFQVLSLVEMDSENKSKKLSRRSIYRRQLVSFLMLGTAKEQPHPFYGRSVDDAMLDAKAVAYASRILYSRPFLLYVIGVILDKTSFSVTVFDRAGMLSSERRAFSANLDVFVRVIRRLSRDMSLVDLGHNPNMYLSPGHTYRQTAYPSFVVETGGVSSECQRFLTEGKPIFISMSLMGRGASVWNICYGEQPAMLVVAWRMESTTGNSGSGGLLSSFQPSQPGRGTCMVAGDFLWPDHDLPQDIESVRKCKLKDKNNLVLHYLVITPAGKMLWDANSDVELVSGLLAAIQGYIAMPNKDTISLGILPDTIYLWDEHRNGTPAPPGMEGYIVGPDTESSSEPVDSLVTTQMQSTMECNITSLMRGSPFEAPFLPYNILRAALNSKIIVRTEHHDMESFLLVFFYALTRRALIQHPKNERVREIFHDVFLCTDLSKLRWERKALWVGAFAPVQRCLSEELAALACFLAGVMSAQNEVVDDELRPLLNFKGSKFSSPPESVPIKCELVEDIFMQVKDVLVSS
ncbi:hypothetical protein E4T56_gene21025 [Termitomyces sp. T112]|nr:hypothetical protein E4T56_gene21025 [Termitomyces sp. T112]